MQIFIDNNINVTRNITILDFVDSNFIAGSFSTPGPSIINTTTGPISGTIYGWNLTLVNVSSIEINYSITGIGDYELGRNFFIGLE